MHSILYSYCLHFGITARLWWLGAEIVRANPNAYYYAHASYYAYINKKREHWHVQFHLFEAFY